MDDWYQIPLLLLLLLLLLIKTSLWMREALLPSNSLQVIDLARVSQELAYLASDADLVVLEGMVSSYLFRKVVYLETIVWFQRLCLFFVSFAIKLGHPNATYVSSNEF